MNEVKINVMYYIFIYLYLVYDRIFFFYSFMKVYFLNCKIL